MSASTNIPTHYALRLSQLLGFFWLILLVRLLPDAATLFSSDGIFNSGDELGNICPAPFILCSFDSKYVVYALFLGAATLALGMMIGKWHWSGCFVLIYFLQNLIIRTPEFANLSLAFLGLITFSVAAMKDRGNLWNPQRTVATFRFLRVMAIICYTFSGLSKLLIPEWRQGAICEILRFSHIELACSNPWISQWLGLAVIAVELLYGLSLFHRYLAWFFWAAITAMHFGILLVLPLKELSFVMLLFQLFVVPEVPAWVTRARLLPAPT